ncbi:MAG: phosphopyruvate hydratase [Clostridia bacterium]|nr:phosphopyruvate hydratase [Clostridia bacterium]
MERIERIKAYEIFDSRGNPTVHVKITTENGVTGEASVPSGASTGAFEAYELRDSDSNVLNGKGVKRAVKNINDIIEPALKNLYVSNQEKIDRIMIELDKTENKSRLGANAILGVSLAAARTAANAYKMPLYRYLGGANARVMPKPMMNILNGGAHAANNIDIQEFMIMPVATDSFYESMRICTEIYHKLKGILESKGLSTAVGDEGGFAPNLESDEQAIEYIIDAINFAGYNTENVKICLDAAASEWQKENGLYMMPKRKKGYDTENLIKMWKSLTKKYPIISIEDALGENDYEGFEKLTALIGSEVQLVGDDLFVTNEKRLNKGIEMSAANSILIKPNQIGTLSETLKVIRLAQKSGYRTIISHRSGETEDSFIADLAVGVNAGQIKTGAPCRSERVAKYNRLLIIEEEMNK